MSERLIAIRHNRHISAFQRGLNVEFCTNRIDYAGLSDVRIGVPTRIRIIFDKRPFAWTLPMGMLFTMTGLLNLAFSTNLYWVLFSVFIIGIGSSVLHPEASRITSLASGGRRGLAQSLFQVGGNLGGSLGPLLVALIVAPYGRHNIALFAILSVIAIMVMIPVGKWYKRYITRMKRDHIALQPHMQMPLPMEKRFFPFLSC